MQDDEQQGSTHAHPSSMGLEERGSAAPAEVGAGSGPMHIPLAWALKREGQQHQQK